ncbi:MAG: hypothetical protein AAB425_01375, partial [Bdellovibrionota bacterium]
MIRSLGSKNARKGFLQTRLLHSKPDHLEGLFVREMRDRLAKAKTLTAKSVLSMTEESLNSIFGTQKYTGASLGFDSIWPLPIYGNYLKLILDATEAVPAPSRSQLLDDLLRNFGEDGSGNPIWHWNAIQSEIDRREIAVRLVKAMPSHQMSRLQGLLEVRTESTQADFPRIFRDLYEREIDSWRKIPDPATRAAAYLNFARDVLGAEEKRVMSDLAYFRIADRFHAALEREVFPAGVVSSILEQSLKSGPTLETDRIIRKHLLRDKGFSPRALFSFLKEARIHDLELNATLAERAIESWVKNLRKPPSKAEITELTTLINQILPGYSSPRDRLIERLSWQLQLHDMGDLKHLASLKMLGDRQSVSPFLVQALSGLDQFLDTLKPSEIDAVWKYIDQPTRGSL